ncbi:MAG: aminotransferase class I/II-fold pyridoxal phosphate-dependent enzyme [Bacteroidales bacterium]|jgi:glycine C-acetyltransferase|nr:aminotransferase class I/II-fold pyridoxal phosphate-dependent enzyme [Bacteroidales bacterium]
MIDIFKRIKEMPGPLGKYQKDADGYFMFPQLEGEIGPRMKFAGKEVLNWSLNNYLGLANHPEVRQADNEGARMFGMAAPMGARMMSGDTKYHKELEQKLAHFVGKPAGYLANFGYQAMVSIIDALTNRHDIIVYDAEAHACIVDGKRLHIGRSFVYPHNDINKLKEVLTRATKFAEEQNGGILLITEGVFGMSGNLGQLDEIVALKKEFNFRILIDDAHGFGTMGKTGAGTAEHFNVSKDIDIHFATFAKSMAGIGAFVASEKEIVDYLRYNMRSQIYAKSLPMPMVIGALKRLELLQTKPELREKLWTITRTLQSKLREKGFNIGTTKSPVTPVLLNGNIDQATNLVVDLRENYNIFCSIVVYPVVPKDVIMLRLIPTAAHELEDVERTVNVFSELKEKLDKGVYNTGEIAHKHISK